MSQAQREMDDAAARWLDSYRGHERYLIATETLFEVFARGFNGSRRNVVEAFSEFRSALLKEHRVNCPEAFKVIPRQTPDIE